jgi:hypothetical protein
LCSSLKSFARRKKTTGDGKASKSAQVPGLPIEESFEPKSGCWVGQMSLLYKINTKNVLWPHTDSGFCGMATQNNAKVTHDW